MEKIAICFVCKNNIATRKVKRGTPRKYCSKACRQAAYRVREKEKREETKLDVLLGVIAKAQDVLDPAYSKDLELIHNIIKLHYTAVPFDAKDITTWSNNRTPKIVAIYEYKDETGQLLYEVIRLQPKAFRQRRKDPKNSNKYLWNLGKTRRVLYKLPEVSKGVSNGEVIFIVEGEKDVDILFSYGLIATTCPNGALKWRQEYSESLRNAKVVILPDNDSIGRGHANQVMQSLEGIAKSVKIVELPNLPTKGDVTDWLESYGSKEKLMALIN